MNLRIVHRCRYLSIRHGASCISKIKFEEPGKLGGVAIESFSVSLFAQVLHCIATTSTC